MATLYIVASRRVLLCNLTISLFLCLPITIYKLGLGSIPRQENYSDQLIRTIKRTCDVTWLFYRTKSTFHRFPFWNQLYDIYFCSKCSEILMVPRVDQREMQRLSFMGQRFHQQCTCPHRVISYVWSFWSAIKHETRFDYVRVPAIVELCIQAGIDLIELSECPSLHRNKPTRMLGRKAIEYSEFVDKRKRCLATNFPSPLLEVDSDGVLSDF